MVKHPLQFARGHQKAKERNGKSAKKPKSGMAKAQKSQRAQKIKNKKVEVLIRLGRLKLDIKYWSLIRNWSASWRMPIRNLLSARKLVTILIFLILVSSAIYWYIFKDLPSPGRLTTNTYPISTLIFDRHGQVLYEIFADQNRIPVNLDQLPDYIKQSTIAIEDKDFYRHHGLSFTGILRAAWKNVKYVMCSMLRETCPSSFQGGSTITQQLVKNALLSPERTWRRKIKEVLLTIAVEVRYSKDEILEMYLNHVPYGGTAYGIESAAQTYFSKSAKELTLDEATVLAGLPAAPTRYSPFGVDPQAYKIRQQAVLRRMTEDGYLTGDQVDQILNNPVQFNSPANLIHAPHFVLWIKELLVEKYGQQTVEQGGLRVYTTLDLELQTLAQDTIKNQIDQLPDSYRVTNGAALITQPTTGQILAMVGSADYFNSRIDGNVNLTLRFRQPGSSIKPLNYALGFATGKITPSSLLADIPTCFSVVGQSLYCPENYDGQSHGLVQSRFALANSYNIPAVRVLAKNDLRSFIATASAVGITGWDDPSKYGLSLTLGGGEVRMVDMAAAYGTLANLGQRVNLVPILKVENSKGEVLEEWQCESTIGASPAAGADLQSAPNISSKSLIPTCNSQQVLSPESAYLVTNILSDAAARAPTFGSNLNINGHPEVAVKTGTTNDLRDNWTLGYTSNYLVATWVGNFDNTPMARIASGITGAAPIWKAIMSHLLTKYDLNVGAGLSRPTEGAGTAPLQTTWPRPKGIVDLPVCVESGLAVSPDPNSPCTPRPEIFIKDYLPQHHASGRRPWPIDKTTNRPATDRTLPENIELRDQTIYFDILGTAVCTDCSPPEDPVIIKYPLTQ